MKKHSILTRIRSLAVLGTVLAASAVTHVSVFAAESPAKAIESSEKAPLDFDLQGEYMGIIENWGGNWGAQVIALGNGELQLNLIEGGLPGLKSDSSKPKHTLTLKIDEKSKSASGELGVKKSEDAKAEAVVAKIADGNLTISVPKSEDGNSDGKALGTLAKVERKSSTLGAKPPANATVLYSDEVNLFEGAKASDENLGVGGKSKVKLGDHKLHLEFRTPYQPTERGQGRGNSGVYLQGRYELQVLDSFGLEGKDNECGGIYSISSPKLNMCYPPKSWQTYDIDFKAARFENGKKTENARVTIKHNGVVIHDNLELTSGTPGYLPEGPEKAELYLQDHGNPVEFRNVWVVQESK